MRNLANKSSAPSAQVPVKRIAHITTVHSREDTRIFLKQCRTLASRAGYAVHLIVADGKGDTTLEDIRILDTGLARGKLRRITLSVWRVFKKTLSLRPDIVHFHDPELILVGLTLRLLGIHVVYDVHEDFPRQIRSNTWLSPLVRWPISLTLPMLELLSARFFSSVITVTPTIAARFPTNNTTIVSNFPIPTELTSYKSTEERSGNPYFAYVGMITSIRGANTMMEAIGILNQNCGARLKLAGKIVPPSLEDELRSLPAWRYVDFFGWASRQQVVGILGSVRAGLVVLHPTRNYPNAYPVKMFEYMSAGIPVIASDFPLWRSIIENANCGLLVDPQDPASIARAMQWILENQEEAAAMGQRGRKAIEETYNWEREAEKLIAVYRRILAPDKRAGEPS